MKFQYGSDFHADMQWKRRDLLLYIKGDIQECFPWAEHKTADVLVINGDTSNYHELTGKVLLEALKYWPTVIFTDGNHDHYDNSYNDRTVGDDVEYFTELAKNNPGLHYLNGKGTGVLIDGTLFIGACGWYNWMSCEGISREIQHERWKKEINDAKCIRFNVASYPDRLAYRHANELREMVAEAQTNPDVKNIVILTHTVPHIKGVVPMGHQWWPLNGSYHNTFMEQVWTQPHDKVKFWLFGHTHEFYDFLAEDILFKSNPRGYAGEKRTKDFETFVELDTEEQKFFSAFGEIEQ
jgi:predicted phosphodiesterase